MTDPDKPRAVLVLWLFLALAVAMAFILAAVL